MHDILLSFTCLMMIVSPCMVAVWGRMDAEDMEIE